MHGNDKEPRQKGTMLTWFPRFLVFLKENEETCGGHVGGVPPYPAPHGFLVFIEKQKENEGPRSTWFLFVLVPCHFPRVNPMSRLKNIFEHWFFSYLDRDLSLQTSPAGCIYSFSWGIRIWSQKSKISGVRVENLGPNISKTYFLNPITRLPWEGISRFERSRVCRWCEAAKPQKRGFWRPRACMWSRQASGNVVSWWLISPLWRKLNTLKKDKRRKKEKQGDFFKDFII